MKSSAYLLLFILSLNTYGTSEGSGVPVPSSDRTAARVGRYRPFSEAREWAVGWAKEKLLEGKQSRPGVVVCRGVRGPSTGHS